MTESAIGYEIFDGAVDFEVKPAWLAWTDGNRRSHRAPTETGAIIGQLSLRTLESIIYDEKNIHVGLPHGV